MKKLLLLAIGFALSVSAYADSGREGERHDKFPRPVTNADYRNATNQVPEKVELGRLLFFDKIISGNKNIACATCHHPMTGTADGLSLGMGEGANGLSVARDSGVGSAAVHVRVPRNAPAIFNLGAKEFTNLFHDGRVSVDASKPSGFNTPAGDQLPLGLDDVLAAQAMFPVTSDTEMAGQPGENEISALSAANRLGGPGGVWDTLAQRLAAIPEYVALFKKAYSDVKGPGDITFRHAANAIAAFEADAWRADNSPFDRYLRGDRSAMSFDAYEGMRLFYGKAGCSSCHSGAFQSDQDFHAIAMPQIGPGKGNDADGHGDWGHYNVTHIAADKYRFRTPTLRNVVLSGPWGHDGAYATLQGVIRQHLNPVQSLMNFDTAQCILTDRSDLNHVDFIVQHDANRVMEIAAANELPPANLSDREIDRLIDFLGALTDPSSIDLRRDVPKHVPSGLTVFD